MAVFFWKPDGRRVLVQIREDGRECFARVKLLLNLLAESPRKPSLILLDLMMPVLDGWTFCKVRQGVQMLMEIPVVAISAAPMNGPQEPLRVDATLPKPFDPDALAWLATRMVGRKGFYGSRH